MAKQEEEPNKAKFLFETMKRDASNFNRMICISSGFMYDDTYNSVPKYWDTPILRHIDHKQFVDCLIEIQKNKPEDFGFILYSISKRYENNSEVLLHEKEWFKSVHRFLLEQASEKQKTITGFVLKRLIDYYFKEIIEGFD